MNIVRYFFLVLILCFAALALVGTVPIALFHQKVDAFDQDGEATVTLWEIKMGKVEASGGDGMISTVTPAGSPARINYAKCGQLKSSFRAMQAFSIAGTIFGFYTFFVSCLQCMCKLKVKLPLLIFVILAFVSELILVCIGGASYAKAFCSDTTEAVTPFKDAGYKIGPAYILEIVACAGYFVLIFMAPFTQEMWCGEF